MRRGDAAGLEVLSPPRSTAESLDFTWASLAEVLARREVASQGAARPWQLEHHAVLDSTNRLAWTRGLEGAREGRVVVADAQTAGRGRLQRAWHSPSGVNLYASLLLRPRVKLENVALLNLVAAVAAAQACRTLGADVGIKWPNDLLSRDGWKKVCGILAELKTDGRQVEFVVLGIGVNVNLAEQDLPELLQSRATSLSVLVGRPLAIPDLLRHFLDSFWPLYALFVNNELEPIFQLWRTLNLTLGRTVSFELEGRQVLGTALDVDIGGSLLVSTAEGIARVTAGDVGLVQGEQP